MTLPWYALFILDHRTLPRPAVICICGFNFQGTKKHSKKPLLLKLTHYPLGSTIHSKNNGYKYTC